MALVQPEQGKHYHRGAERDIEPEDPLPGQPLHDRAFGDRAAEDGEAGHAAERPRS
jgi:hypothetical protein